MSKKHDLTFVPPERRAEVLRRIDVIERFVRHPGRKAAEAAADELGLRVAQFYNLVRAWRTRPQPEAVIGAGGRRTRRSSMTAEEIDFIAAMIATHPRLSAGELVDEIMRLAQLKHRIMPSRERIVRHVRLHRPAMLTGDVIEHADIVVDRTVLDLPVRYGGETRRPLATMVIDVASNSIIGLSLSEGLPTPDGIAEALLHAVTRGFRSQAKAPNRQLRVLIVVGDLNEIGEVATLLGDNGVAVRVAKAGPHSGGEYVEALLGARHAGIVFRRRFVWNESRRPIVGGAGQMPLTPTDALSLARGRLVGPPSYSALGMLDDAARHRILEGLTVVGPDPQPN